MRLANLVAQAAISLSRAFSRARVASSALGSGMKHLVRLRAFKPNNLACEVHAEEVIYAREVSHSIA